MKAKLSLCLSLSLLPSLIHSSLMSSFYNAIKFIFNIFPSLFLFFAFVIKKPFVLFDYALWNAMWCATMLDNNRVHHSMAMTGSGYYGCMHHLPTSLYLGHGGVHQSISIGGWWTVHKIWSTDAVHQCIYGWPHNTNQHQGLYSCHKSYKRTLSWLGWRSSWTSPGASPLSRGSCQTNSF